MGINFKEVMTTKPSMPARLAFRASRRVDEDMRMRSIEAEAGVAPMGIAEMDAEPDAVNVETS